MKNEQGKVLAVCISKNKGEIKTPVDNINLKENWGIVSDAHAGNWHRQVSILAREDVVDMEKKIHTKLSPGIFAENILTEGFGWSDSPIGSLIEFSSGVILELTQIGKECHNDCAIRKQTGDCVMPRKGLFFKVIKGGNIKPGDTFKLVSKYNAGVIVVSTSCFNKTRQDEAGEKIIEMLEKLKYKVVEKVIVSDDKEQIKKELIRLSENADILFTIGGTGFSPSDITPEATTEIIDRTAPGISEKMRYESGKISKNSYLSRGISGIRNKTLIINLPGSTRGASECLSSISDILGHGLKMLVGDSKHS